MNTKILHIAFATVLLAVAGCTSTTTCNPNTMTTFDYLFCGGQDNVDKKVSDVHDEWATAQGQGDVLRNKLNNLKNEELVLRNQLRKLHHENFQLKNEIEQLVSEVNAATNATSKAVIAKDIEHSVNKMADNLDRFVDTAEYAIKTDNLVLLQEIIETASNIKDINDIKKELERTKSESKAMRLAGKKIAKKAATGGVVSAIVRVTPWGRMASIFFNVLNLAD